MKDSSKSHKDKGSTSSQQPKRPVPPVQKEENESESYWPASGVLGDEGGGGISAGGTPGSTSGAGLGKDPSKGS